MDVMERLRELEKIRFSITRLKPSFSNLLLFIEYSWKDKILDYEIETLSYMYSNQVYHHESTWKDKILDYEIETRTEPYDAPYCISLEKIRFSITRLKLDCFAFLEQYPDPWKDKILDYEIETITSVDVTFTHPPWKDKILDYEIETSICEGGSDVFWCLKR